MSFQATHEERKQTERETGLKQIDLKSAVELCPIDHPRASQFVTEHEPVSKSINK